jgi:hypothetical protein
LKLRFPTRRTVHILWLIVAAVVALVFTRGTLPIVFLGVFFVVWLVGFGVLTRAYRRWDENS